jgi:hypothetical protein
MADARSRPSVGRGVMFSVEVGLGGGWVGSWAHGNEDSEKGEMGLPAAAVGLGTSRFDPAKPDGREMTAAIIIAHASRRLAPHR